MDHNGRHKKNFNQLFLQNEVVESIGNPAGIGQGTGLGLQEQDRDGISLGHSRLRANSKQQQVDNFISHFVYITCYFAQPIS